MRRSRAAALLVASLILAPVRELVGQDLQIGIIDFYELNRVSAAGGSGTAGKPAPTNGWPPRVDRL